MKNVLVVDDDRVTRHLLQSVLEKAGYELECRMRKSVTKDGETIDELIYAVIRI